MGKHVIQIYLNDEEYVFLKQCATETGKSLAQTLLYLSDFKNRMRDVPLSRTDENFITGLSGSDRPFEDYEY